VSGGVASLPNPFDTIFEFNSTVHDFGLALAVTKSLGPGYSGYDSLVLGSGSGAGLAGSSETCQENSTACGGPSYLDGRLVTSGTLYAPEPASVTLLTVGGAALTMLRQRRLRPRRSVA
jgi:hypothetical protein